MELEDKIKHTAKTLYHHNTIPTQNQLKDILFSDITQNYDIDEQTLDRAVLREQLYYMNSYIIKEK